MAIFQTASLLIRIVLRAAWRDDLAAHMWSTAAESLVFSVCVRVLGANLIYLFLRRGPYSPTRRSNKCRSESSCQFVNGCQVVALFLDHQ